MCKPNLVSLPKLPLDPIAVSGLLAKLEETDVTISDVQSMLSQLLRVKLPASALH